MKRHLAFFALTIATAGCSQRAPWVVVQTAPVVATSSPASAPRTTTAPAQSESTTTPKTSGIALSAVAAAPDALDASAVAHLKGMLFPVAGAKDSVRLDDSFDAPRDGGRRHNAIDIMAPRGTPIIAVSDGRILRLSKSVKGGLTLYATDLEDQFVYYYAHLDKYNPKVYSGKPLMRGDTLGYVGTTGNSPPNLPHLHFQVMRMGPNGQYWNGTPINPYPLLHATNAEK
jgi:murein DD-endopeptidase MepM/ murein hydrolase activator NlpD